MEEIAPTTPTSRLRVWDRPIRLFHWILVILLIVSFVTANIGGDAMAYHMLSGYTILTLVLFRIVWGFVGKGYARFGSFVAGPRAVLRYARSLVRPPHEVHVGHNPLGGWVVIVLLLLLLAQAVMGLFTNDDIMTDGPLVKLISKDLSDAISSLHRNNAYIILAFVGAHISAVLLYLVVLKDNLIKPMLTGVKELPLEVEEPEQESMALAAVVLMACAVAIWWIVNKL